MDGYVAGCTGDGVAGYVAGCKADGVHECMCDWQDGCYEGESNENLKYFYLVIN